jgi:hypothetical protein
MTYGEITLDYLVKTPRFRLGETGVLGIGIFSGLFK